MFVRTYSILELGDFLEDRAMMIKKLLLQISLEQGGYQYENKLSKAGPKTM